ncbi:hypothetical protein DL766_008435 [Monosporascus sp. MC13-8B]|uniref:Ubiquitin-like domain-containing protein n=1 Tax=Monosporascus cannonballus TaxID=155416 RepID=A0ABY0HI19_9PEZI|nr:hypothetical protein DL763_004521 [Monosporascus cannonballus]RYO93905.1 hypothetical protein DL762_000860 [Monosporascus cannonballus]RYP19463.1 hypothetical protein DL766_008435 [Monosporascus sp. MC13-8B]
MSVGFGFSVGDFLAALKLVGTLIDALRESSHASSSFHSLISELYALESVLLRVKRLDFDDRHNVGKLALRQAASQCQRTTDAFWKEIQKYQPHLQQSGTDSRIRDGWAKVKIPGQVQRQQPVYLIDAFNKESPFLLEFVRSAEALLAVLKANIKISGCDPDMIDRGEFVIEELGTQNSIDLLEPWDSCFYPGQKVAMSVVFKQRRTLKSSCPRCGRDHEEAAGKEITWDFITGAQQQYDRLALSDGLGIPVEDDDTFQLDRSIYSRKRT